MYVGPANPYKNIVYIGGKAVRLYIHTNLQVIPDCAGC